MNNLAPFLALKYVAFGKESNIAFMIRICFLSIFIGTFSLMLTLIIMNGFEKVICEKLQGVNSAITVSASHQKLDVAALTAYINKEFCSQIGAISAGSIHQVIINQNDTQSTLFLKGVDAATIDQVNSIGKKIVLPSIAIDPMKKLLVHNHIIIGHKAAISLGLTVGDEITLLIPEPANKKKILLNKKKAVIAGIFNVGLDEYDTSVAYTSLDFFTQLFDEDKQEILSADTLFIAPKAPISSIKNRLLNLLPFRVQDETETLVNALRQKLPELNIQSWKELSPALVASLKLEKYVMFFILALITLVASMNMISLLFMQIQHKRRDIAIFKSMGMPATTLNRIFLHIGLCITISAALAGLVLAGIAGYILEHYPFIELPDVYYVGAYLPARLDPELFLVVFIATLVLGFIATWIPAQRAQRINVTEVLRQE